MRREALGIRHLALGEEGKGLGIGDWALGKRRREWGLVGRNRAELHFVELLGRFGRKTAEPSW
jgi:hypothetical protein